MTQRLTRSGHNRPVYLMYVDESGDPGSYDPSVPKHFRPSEHYVLSGLIIEASDWRSYLDSLIDIRRKLKSTYGFPMRAELHASELIRPRHCKHSRAIGSKAVRMALYSDYLTEVASRLSRAYVISVNLNKVSPKYSTTTSRDIEEYAWSVLLTRYQNFLNRTGNGDLGMVFADETNEPKVRALLRKARIHNMVPSMYGGPKQTVKATNIIEDPVMRVSGVSFFVQTADLIAHALYRKRYPKGSLKRYNVDKFYNLLNPVLLTAASRTDPQGIVDL